ncbi:hypothetical protein [Mucilaginibacter celer]|uniref:Uncharacterized protein n=1 Tax=Mucilaginibacter celer TaxID=2305508 RepID=A0A494VIY9_9SPHI|nr:hypothetical protein [Mucilaginibacter celer]AYL94194.1 hypothetical protein HYN43_002295 [Mucilaginibacter celer]
MKRSIIILSLLFIITSCAALKNGGVPQYTLGMSEQDFTASQRFNLSLVEATPGHTIYKRTVEVDAQRVVASMYYYFDDGKLVRMRRVEEPKPIVVVEQKRQGL